MDLADPLPIQPFTRPARGAVVVPGSKSITNRALLLAALCESPVVLHGALFSDDTRIMVAALGRLGIRTEADEVRSTITVHGRGGVLPVSEAVLDVGLAGTAARFLTALCAAARRGTYRIGGTNQMHQRPMKGLIDALRSLGADIRCLEKEGFLPIQIEARGLRGGAVAIDASESSQMLSALLMAAPLATEATLITLSKPVREPYVEMTLKLMRQFGAGASSQANSGSAWVAVPRGVYSFGAPGYTVEPDASSASYFAALPLVCGGGVGLEGFRRESLQGDTRFLEVLAEAGLSLSQESRSLVVRFDGRKGRGISRSFRDFSDTFLTFAAIAPLLEGPTRIFGIAHSRKQETDRVAGMSRELRKLGQQVTEEEDSLDILPRPLVPNRTIETYGDHRFAMSFAILGCRDLMGNGVPWLKVRDPGCCAKTYPRFFEDLEALRTASTA
jgi:3-phosphoshikimate 1-carboxyvinyltransferase